jgi:hypothetical protein
MAKQDDIPKTDPSEIEALIQRLKQSNLEPRDTQLIERAKRWRMRRYPFSSTCGGWLPKEAVYAMTHE